MKMVVGLGNPGESYKDTRHNIGFMALSNLAGLHGIKRFKKGFSSLWAKGSLRGCEALLVLPQTYMNLSGQAVREVTDYYGLAPKDLVVLHDDLDLEMGRVKWDFKAGAAGHQGVCSIIEHLGTKEFYRVRMGIGRPGMKQEVTRFVLSAFHRDEMKRVIEDMLPEAALLVEKWVAI